jgi:hypothetical protein
LSIEGHQLKRSLRAIQKRCKCEYLRKIVDFTLCGANSGRILYVLAAVATTLVQMQVRAEEKGAENSFLGQFRGEKLFFFKQQRRGFRAVCLVL